MQAACGKRSTQRTEKHVTDTGGMGVNRRQLLAMLGSSAAVAPLARVGATSGPVRTLLQCGAVVDLGRPMPLYGH